MTTPDGPTDPAQQEAVESTGFDVVLRGYDRRQVDDYLDRVEIALSESDDRHAADAERITVLERQVHSVQEALASAERRAAGAPEPYVDECKDPPCFGGGGLPGARDLPATLPFLGYGLAIALGLPSVLAGGWDVLRGRWAPGGRRLLAFVGPVLVVFGTEILPHLVSPCLPAALGADWLPPVCERTERGVDVADRWHALDHALVGALPMAALYRLALRRWRPDVARLRAA